MFTIAWKELYSVSSPTSNLLIYRLMFLKISFRQSEQRETGNQKSEFRNQNLRIHSYLEIYRQQRKFSSKNVILIYAYDNNYLYCMENKLFLLLFFSNGVWCRGLDVPELCWVAEPEPGSSRQLDPGPGAQDCQPGRLQLHQVPFAHTHQRPFSHLEAAQFSPLRACGFHLQLNLKVAKFHMS